ncbi:DUF4929 family protein [Bacteroides sp. AN502(2024)]|uniref:DUF4929 family protein n=1 Tax=Bacteroides sp. AN502(2024) TaxID=3160599 RepID=UPI0035181709
MKKEMKKLFVYTMGMFLLSLATSCGDEKENTGYTGVNKIHLSAENPVIEEAGATPLTVNVDLTTACEQDVTLNFEVLDDKAGILKLIHNPVTIPAGQKKATFQVVSNQKNLLAVDAYFQIGISAVPVENMALNGTLSVRVKPNPRIPGLSEKQLALIEGYKAKYNIDLTDWLGIISCRTVVNSPAGGSTTPFASEFERILEGKTIVTLSERSTAELPVLKMVDNPMGLTEYCFWVLKQETIENDEYWYDENAGPDYARVMKLLEWNKDNPGTFAMSLDGIHLTKISGGVAKLDFLGEKSKGDGEGSYPVVPFTYVFSPWEYQKKLIAEGNPDAIELKEVDGTADPDHYLMLSSVANDDFGDELNFVAPKGEIDFTAKKMTFQFVVDHYLAGGYTRVTVTYEKK